MDRPKRPPPVPKFEDKRDKTELQAKLNSFMSSISQAQADLPPQPTKAQPIPPKPEVKAQGGAKVEQTKKKATLASINSKLNSMLSAKKININAISAETDKERQEKEERNKKIEVQYDPHLPNNYELTKHHYLKLFAAHLEEDPDYDQEQEQDSYPNPTLQHQPPNQEELDEDPQLQPYVAEEKEQIALRMMQKFGFKVGQGLGKQGQGIKTPLIVKKVNDSSGVIEQSNISLNYLISPEVTAKNALAAHNVSVQTVVVLVGLLTMEQLEQGVEEEIRQECLQFGLLKDWIVFLFAGELRIFVQYQTKEQAFAAFLNMNGKYFGEKLVSVRFYDPQLFSKKQLSLPLHTHIPT